MEWRPIPGYDTYLISDEGAVVNMKFLNPRLIRQSPTTRGYVKVGLWKNDVCYQADTHRHVAAAFLGPAPSPLHEVNHKNRVKTDNRVSNLEWVTKQENADHSHANGGYRFGVDNVNAKLTPSDVLAIRKLRGVAYQKDIAKAFGITQSLVSVVQRGAGWKTT